MKIKREIIVCGTIFILMASLPFIAIGLPNKNQSESKTVKTSTDVSKTERIVTSEKSENNSSQYSKNDKSSEISNSTKTTKVKDSDQIYADGMFKILDTSSGEVLTLSDEEFLIGAIMAEMPPSYETEALKAQCVATYTCYAKKRADERKDPHKELKGADISADLSKKMIYLTPEYMKKDCGSSYDEIYNKLKNIIDNVKGEVLTYNGKIITCTYFAMSNGKTDSFEDIFGNELPYLTPVSSPYDMLAPNYMSEKTITADEFKKTVAAISNDANFSEKEEKWLGKIERTSSETVKTITIGGKKFTGSEIRKAFSLRSSCFEIKYHDNSFRFIVKGYGHNVGMSQYGANEMAKQGATYMEILKHYYSAIDEK